MGFHLYQGQQEEEGVLWFWDCPHRSGGPLQERHVDPQLQGDPENQRQKAGQIGAGYSVIYVINVIFFFGLLINALKYVVR